MIDQFEFSIPFAVCLAESTDGSVLQFVLHQPQGHNGENIVVEHCIQQNSWTVGFPGCDIGQLMSGSVIFKELPGTAAGFTHGKFLPLQISNRQLPPCIKGMRFANRQYQTVINDRQNNRSGERFCPLLRHASSSDFNSFSSISRVCSHRINQHLWKTF